MRPLFEANGVSLAFFPSKSNPSMYHRPMKLFLEMEIGITGGEEDGVNNEDVDNAALYTQPEDIWDIYSAFSKV